MWNYIKIGNGLTHQKESDKKIQKKDYSPYKIADLHGTDALRHPTTCKERSPEERYSLVAISYELSKSPNTYQISNMHRKAFSKFTNTNGIIFHSDQVCNTNIRIIVRN